jgi:type IV pilus assembly protein PilE
MIITKTRRHSNSGFTLIELMIVIVIVAVLVGIALPAFQNQIIRGHRGAAKAAMMDLANRENQYLLANRSYVSDLADFGYTLPDDVGDRYTFSISTLSASGIPFFTIEATPIAAQVSDGPLTLDSEGVKTPADKWER